MESKAPENTTSITSDGPIDSTDGEIVVRGGSGHWSETVVE